MYISEAIWQRDVQNQEGKAPRIKSNEEKFYVLYSIEFVVHFLIWQETWGNYYFLQNMSFLPLRRSFIEFSNFFTKNSKLTPVFEKMFWNICQSFRVILLKTYLHNQNIFSLIFIFQKSPKTLEGIGFLVITKRSFLIWYFFSKYNS